MRFRKLRFSLRDILDGIHATYPPEKRAADLKSGTICGAVYRPLSFYTTAVFIRLGFSPNAVTCLRYVAIAAECSFFVIGTYGCMIAGSICHVCHYHLDMVDGNIARYTARPTRFGALLDGMADRLGYTLPPTTIGVGLYNHPDRLISILLPSTLYWLPLTMGLITTFGTVVLHTWNPDRLKEFIALARMGKNRSSVAPIAKSKRSDGKTLRLRIFTGLELLFSNAAHTLEVLIVLLAIYDVISAFLFFRFAYYVSSRIWLAAERFHSIMGHSSHRI